jgi:hypothetical protein
MRQWGWRQCGGGRRLAHDQGARRWLGRADRTRGCVDINVGVQLSNLRAGRLDRQAWPRDRLGRRRRQGWDELDAGRRGRRAERALVRLAARTLSLQRRGSHWGVLAVAQALLVPCRNATAAPEHSSWRAGTPSGTAARVRPTWPVPSAVCAWAAAISAATGVPSGALAMVAGWRCAGGGKVGHDGRHERRTCNRAFRVARGVCGAGRLCTGGHAGHRDATAAKDWVRRGGVRARKLRQVVRVVSSFSGYMSIPSKRL